MSSPRERATRNVPQKRRAYVNRFPGLKWCPQCAEFRSRDAFGFDRTRDDGLSGWCRACRARGEKSRRDANVEQTRQTLRTRYRTDPARWHAHVAVARAVAAGVLTKPTSCPTCQRQRRIEAHHHRGYARKNWLDVVWRCRQCHTLDHKRGHHHVATDATEVGV